MKAKQWNVLVIGGTVFMLTFFALSTIVIDPFLHYHEPLSFLEYPLKDERYQNDGIARHYQYDSIITGTSMSQNFRCSEFDALWEAKSVKMAYSGVSFHKLNENLRRAFSHQSNIRYVVCSLDGSRINTPAWQDEYTGYPEYLYDENFFNDASYLLNKEVVPKTLAVINYTRAGEVTPDRDMYGNWSQYKSFGPEAVLKDFTPLPVSDVEILITEEDVTTITENITQNFLKTALEHPDTEFYFFFPPYSICYWDSLVRSKQLGMQLEAQMLAARLLLTAENVHVYDFSSRTDIIGNLDNYTDTLHYSDSINSEILSCMRDGRHELTYKNLEAYYEEILLLYEGFDYSAYR